MNIYRKSDIPEHLHKYFKPAEIGLEHTPDEYVNELVQVFREVKRVLRDDGTVWLNLGDSYNGSGKAGSNPEYQSKHTEFGKPSTHKERFGKPTRIKNLKPKDLIGIPWRVAFALQADGWYLRQDIIWHKPNPMPESVKDRCTKAHEYVFLLSKSPIYYFDNNAIKEKAARNRWGGKKPINVSNSKDTSNQFSGLTRERDMMPETRNRRSVWTINTKPYNGVHFATFPNALVEPCIFAGCPVGGTVLDPFGGSGTVGECCRLNQLNAILIELNPEYEPLIRQRIGSEVPELSTFEAII